MPCIFCELQENKDNIIYENEDVYVVVDRYPYTTCHLLVIVKEHNELLHQNTDEQLLSVMQAIKYLVTALNMEKYNVLQNNINGQDIKHCHFHLIEANKSGCFSTTGNRTIDLEDDAYADLVKKIKSRLKKN